MQTYREGRGLTPGNVRSSEAPRPLRPQPVSLAQSCSALAALGLCSCALPPRSWLCPTGHAFGDSKASLLWQWLLEGPGHLAACRGAALTTSHPASPRASSHPGAARPPI